MAQSWWQCQLYDTISKSRAQHTTRNEQGYNTTLGSKCVRRNLRPSSVPSVSPRVARLPPYALSPVIPESHQSLVEAKAETRGHHTLHSVNARWRRPSHAPAQAGRPVHHLPLSSMTQQTGEGLLDVRPMQIMRVKEMVSRPISTIST